MIAALSPRFLGTRAPIYQTAEQISKQGFFRGYYSMDIEADTEQGDTKALFERTGIVPVSFCMVPGIAATEEEFSRQLQTAPALIQKAAEAGYQTATTWIMPGSNVLPPQAYHAQIVERLRKLCELLAPYHIPLAVELVAPDTLRRSYRYPIGCRTKDLLEILRQVEMDHIGVCMDCFHAYCTGRQEEEYAAITDVNQLVVVHISDAVAGVSPSEQQDQKRHLPGESGLVDYETVFTWLEEIGYTGAVVLEAIDEKFGKRPFEVNLQEAAQAVRRVWPEDRE